MRLQVNDELGVFILISSHSSWPQVNKIKKKKIVSFLHLSPRFQSVNNTGALFNTSVHLTYQYLSLLI